MISSTEVKALKKFPKRFRAEESKHTSFNAWDKVFFETGTPNDLLQPYQRFEEITNFLRQHNVKTVLDIACGSGRHSIALAQQGFYVYAADVSRAALALAEQQTKKHQVQDLVHLFVGDMFGRYDFPNSSLDSAIAIQAIYHGYPNDTQKAIDETARVLKMGGVFIFTLSRDPDRSMLGSDVKESKQVDYKTYLPLYGRERGLPHFYPNEEDITLMLNGKFSEKKIIIDEINKYYLVYCVK